MAKKYYDPLSDMSRIKESLMSLFEGADDVANLIMPHKDDENFTWEENWYGGRYEITESGETKFTDLVGHCFDRPYIEGTVTDNRCAIFIETYLLRLESQHIKQVGVDIFVVCHKDFIQLSEDEKERYNKKGIYGNRVDSAVQAINSIINNPNAMSVIKKRYSIGDLTLSERNPIKQYIPSSKFYGKCLSYTYDTFYQRKDHVR